MPALGLGWRLAINQSQYLVSSYTAISTNAAPKHPLPSQFVSLSFGCISEVLDHSLSLTVHQ